MRERENYERKRLLTRPTESLSTVYQSAKWRETVREKIFLRVLEKTRPVSVKRTARKWQIPNSVFFNYDLYYFFRNPLSEALRIRAWERYRRRAQWKFSLRKSRVHFKWIISCVSSHRDFKWEHLNLGKTFSLINESIFSKAIMYKLQFRCKMYTDLVLKPLE